LLPLLAQAASAALEVSTSNERFIGDSFS